MTDENKFPTCYELSILLPEEDKEHLVLLLNHLGEYEFVEGMVDCDIEFDHNSATFVRDYYAELAKLSPIVLYSEDLEHLKRLRENLLAKAPNFHLLLSDSAIGLGPIADQNWRESWKASFKPVFISSLFALIPPWEAQNTFSQKHRIIIDPGMAFGTGQHETTKVCLEIFCQLNQSQGISPKRLLDVGTGSGVLAIAASLVGVPFVFANDIDSPSIAIAKENARQNLCENIIFTDKLLHEFAESNFDFIFANIQFTPLCKLMPHILQKAAAGATLVFSGILVAEKEDFLRFLGSQNLRVLETRDLGHWSGLVCTT